MQRLGLRKPDPFSVTAGKVTLSEPENITYVLLLSSKAAQASGLDVLYPSLTHHVFKLVGDVFAASAEEQAEDVRFFCSNFKTRRSRSVKIPLAFKNIVCDAEVCTSEVDLYDYLDTFFYDTASVDCISHAFRA